MVPHLALRRSAIPEFSHCHRLQTVSKGILQQFGRSALPCPTRRQLLWRVGENFGECSGLTAGIEHHEVVEDEPLQLSRAASALLAQRSNLAFSGSEFSLNSGDNGIVPLPDALQLCFHPLALARECGKVGIVAVSVGIAAQFGFSHGFAMSADGSIGIAASLCELSFQRCEHIGVLNGIDSAVDGVDFLLAAAEEVSGLQHIIHRRHEALMDIASRKIARESSKEA